ncbi:MAG TPA: thrombospondin type 3 repeat-containing protein [Gemmatimonadales bacterium]
MCKPQPPPPPVLDTDLDGVPDNLDKCPGTPTGTTVDASGCAVQPPVLDTDLDGVPDNLDQCPGTPTGTTVDASGCAVQPPTPTCPVSQLSLGTGTIEGNVYNTALSWPNNGLGNWCIHVTGVTETGATVEAMQLTGASGYYLFTGLPAGTYTVCEVTEGTTCLTSFFLGDGWGASWNNFYTRPL